MTRKKGMHVDKKAESCEPDPDYDRAAQFWDLLESSNAPERVSYVLDIMLVESNQESAGDEIEVTPEMIAAGLSVLDEYPLIDVWDGYASSADMVKAIYLAMTGEQSLSRPKCP